MFKQNFGVIKEDAFEVEVEFTGWAAKYVSERIWSPDQKIVQNNGKVAGQAVFHLHFHVIPRFNDNGHQWNWAAKSYDDPREMTVLAD